MSELELLRAERDALRAFAELHTGGCQSPHGGKCGCGWNLIEARLEELNGGLAEHIKWLRGSVDISYEDDIERTNEILAKLSQVTP